MLFGAMNECKGAAGGYNTWDNLNIQTPAWACKDCNGDLTDENISCDSVSGINDCSVLALQFSSLQDGNMNYIKFQPVAHV